MASLSSRRTRSGCDRSSLRATTISHPQAMSEARRTSSCCWVSTCQSPSNSRPMRNPRYARSIRLTCKSGKTISGLIAGSGSPFATTTHRNRDSCGDSTPCLTSGATSRARTIPRRPLPQSIMAKRSSGAAWPSSTAQSPMARRWSGPTSAAQSNHVRAGVVTVRDSTSVT